MLDMKLYNSAVSK